MRVIVTRPEAQALPWVAELMALGVDARALPLIGIAPADDVRPLQAAWQRLPALALVIFVSANAVEHFFAARPERAAWPPGLAAASTGPGTSGALRAAGVSSIHEPASATLQFDSEALWAVLALQSWRGLQVLVVRGEAGRDWLADQLRGQGAAISFVAAYRRLPPTLDDAAQALLQAAVVAPARHVWLFSSSQAVAHLCTLAPQADWSRARALASHPRIAQAARRAGFGQVEIVAPRPQAVASKLHAT